MAVTYDYGKLSREMAHKLGVARSTRGWTLKNAASACGCSVSTIWNLENCQRVPSVTLAGDIRRAYQFDREDDDRPDVGSGKECGQGEARQG